MNPERYEEKINETKANNAAIDKISKNMKSAYDEFVTMTGNNSKVKFLQNGGEIQIKFPNGHYILALRNGLALVETSVGINLIAENFETSQVLHQINSLPALEEITGDY